MTMARCALVCDETGGKNVVMSFETGPCDARVTFLDEPRVVALLFLASEALLCTMLVELFC